MKKEDRKLLTVTAVTVAANLVLFLIKLYSGLATSSLCIYSDAINNLFDTLSCLIALGGVILMNRNPGKAFPDGLGKAEDLAGFIMAVSVGFTGVYFSYLALDRFFYPRPVNFLVRHAVLLAATIIVKLVIGLICRREYKKLPSVILKTVYLDSFADCGVTAMTLLSFVLSNYSGLRADAIFGLVISVSIIVNAVKLIISSASELLGKNNEKTAEEITDILTGCGFEVSGVKLYKTGTHVTAAVTVSGGGDKKAAEETAGKLCGAEIYFRDNG